MNTKTIYVVMGSTGGPVDHMEWPVKAYFSKESAENHAAKASQKAKEIRNSRIKNGRAYALLSDEDRNEFDPRMLMYYEGTDYFVYEVPMADEDTK